MTGRGKADFPLGLTVAVAIVLLILVGLGTWQMQRLGWKRGLLAEYARTEALPPQALEDLLGSREDAAWRRAILASCSIDPQQIVYLHGVAEGQAGYHLLVPCPAADGFILTDIGFLTEKASQGQPVSLTDVEGRLRPNDKPNDFIPPNDAARDDWYRRDPVELSARWGVKLREDYYLALSVPGPYGATPVDVRRNLSNRHLEYALTWYGLAAALAAIYVAMLLRRRG